uniref:Uncharacterized protein n=1 Tax=Cacopsylla melanoneura TaxID=428564 RepID=A0A8D8T7R5_9HEMI
MVGIRMYFDIFDCKSLKLPTYLALFPCCFVCVCLASQVLLVFVHDFISVRTLCPLQDTQIHFSFNNHHILYKTLCMINEFRKVYTVNRCKCITVLFVMPA